MEIIFFLYSQVKGSDNGGFSNGSTHLHNDVGGGGEFCWKGGGGGEESKTGIGVKQIIAVYVIRWVCTIQSKIFSMKPKIEDFVKDIVIVWWYDKIIKR